MKIRRIRFARWTAKARDTGRHTHTHTHTHTAYVTLIELLQLKCEIYTYCFFKATMVTETRLSRYMASLVYDNNEVHPHGHVV